MQYRYHLLKYNGRETRLTCPSCGKQHCFTPYVDDQDHIVGPEYGVCDHVNSCGYRKYPPSDDYWQSKSQRYDRFPSIPEQRTSRITRRPEPKSEPEGGIHTIPIDLVRRTVKLTPKSSFVQFLLTLFDADTVRRLVCDYCIGVTKSGDAVFYEIDSLGRVRTGKVMKYDAATGHRIKDDDMPNRVTWVHSLLLQQGALPEGWSLTQCLYGEHLLKRNPEKTVCLVEAEKTAIIASAIMPQQIWVATGGRGQLNDRLDVLYGRKIIAFPDLDAHDEWVEKLGRRPYLNIYVSDLLKQEAERRSLPATTDIADIIIGWMHDQSAGNGGGQNCESGPVQESNSVLADILNVAPIPVLFHAELTNWIRDFDYRLVGFSSCPTRKHENDEAE